MPTPERLVAFVNFLTVLVLSTSLHELAHAWTATKFGDPTPRDAGRLTFNPFRHLDLFWSIVLPSVLWWMTGSFMVAAWTPVSPHLMRRPRLHGLLTALAGPATNALLALLALATWCALVVAQEGVDRADRWQSLAALALVMNISLGIFNMIPIPPLDGSHLLEALAPRFLHPPLEWLKRNSMVIFVVLLATGLLSAVTKPIRREAVAASEDVLHRVVEVVRGR
jgi:Zn-dependent protease